ncbi:SRPBCC family protein [Jongsikchunia kroppenstedtii]|uniref:SRPBCC family protein n=1 Tax=Jongsikchunia kroppenstedtii TaxID=1121721 RepID=UPI0003A16D0B|nr:SRPBCC family protein [Jongsikchunia kroppenstedtii]
MKNIERSSTIEVPVSAAFEYVDEAANVPKWMYGVSTFEPLTEQTHGLGATFKSAMVVGPKTFPSVMKCTAWEQNKLIVMESIEGTICVTRWKFTELGPTSTRVDMEFGYDLGGGLAGKALNKVVEPVVGVAVSSTENKLRELVEAAHAD